MKISFYGEFSTKTDIKDSLNSKALQPAVNIEVGVRKIDTIEGATTATIGSLCSAADKKELKSSRPMRAS